MRITFPPFSNRLSTSTRSFPLAQQQVRWMHGAGTPITSTSSTLLKSILLVTYDAPKQHNLTGPQRTGCTFFAFRWFEVRLYVLGSTGQKPPKVCDGKINNEPRCRQSLISFPDLYSLSNNCTTFLHRRTRS